MKDYEYKKNIKLMCTISQEDNHLVVNYPEILLKDCNNQLPCLILVKYDDFCNEIMRLKKIDLDEEILVVERFNRKHFFTWSLVSIFITKEEIKEFNYLLTKNANK